MELEDLYKEIKLALNTADGIENYVKRSYGLVFDYCIARYVFYESEFSVYKRYRTPEMDLEEYTIENKDYHYIFILLCAIKSPEILEILNFIILPTDYFTLTEKSILREIEISKRLLK
ncbi:hypothetical protein Q73A0000_07845 [Kaistella flava (ex Peng et al. 2021)]|uniref:Uncharacterized protein n=1 Tax=Kaistella flava (ex Peng et al. 2021) TaxID=2038776 RepID=A0A7M2Y9F8_9FLAO|nr:hypothetical protein [Kaistella flava (ex Peng et al. 2021)]QOW10285.1 hypothetical protein Q73A0000_07845 [Kaistella flava (ex Peng et al. 2021)]